MVQCRWEITFLNYFRVYIFFIIKENIRIYVPQGWLNGWTEWADIFCGQSWVDQLNLILPTVLIFFISYLLFIQFYYSYIFYSLFLQIHMIS